MIVVIGGLATSGKDTVADYLVEKHGFYKTFMSKPLLEALIALDPIIPLGRAEAELFAEAYARHTGIARHPVPVNTMYLHYTDLLEVLSYDESKRNPEVRRLLQKLGTEVGRDMFSESVWLDIVVKEVAEQDNRGRDVVVTGVRFPNELARFRELGAASWRIERPGVEPAQGHSGELQLTAADFGRVINNAGTIADLRTSVDEIVIGTGMR